MTLTAGRPAPAMDGGPAQRITRDLERRIAALRAAAQRVRRRTDAEAVHDLRVASRRLVAFLRSWAPLLAPGAARPARRGLRRLRRELGRTREREVLAAQLAARLATAADELRQGAAPALARLERRVVRGRRAAARYVSARRILRLQARITRASAGLAGRAQDDGGWAGQARELMAGLGTEARGKIAAALAASGDGDLHAARISLKRWRYAAECLSAAFPDEPGPDPASLRALQEVLGSGHDAAVLRDHLVRGARRAARRGETGAAAALERLARDAEDDRRRSVERLGLLAIPPA